MPRAVEGNAEILSRWVMDRVARQSSAVDVPETLTSNWLRIASLPAQILMHDVSAPLERIPSIVSDIKIPTFRYLRLVGSFGTAHDLQAATSPEVIFKETRRIAGGDEPPVEVPPPPSPRKYWTRRGVAEWLVERLAEDPPTLVGIDHGFSFPLRYFEVHRLKPDWPAFLEDFQHHWPTDDDHTYMDFNRVGAFGNGAARKGNARWRRLTEERAAGAKSVFHFGGLNRNARNARSTAISAFPIQARVNALLASAVTLQLLIARARSKRSNAVATSWSSSQMPREMPLPPFV